MAEILWRAGEKKQAVVTMYDMTAHTYAHTCARANAFSIDCLRSWRWGGGRSGGSLHQGHIGKYTYNVVIACSSGQIDLALVLLRKVDSNFVRFLKNTTEVPEGTISPQLAATDPKECLKRYKAAHVHCGNNKSQGDSV